MNKRKKSSYVRPGENLPDFSFIGKIHKEKQPFMKKKKHSLYSILRESGDVLVTVIVIIEFILLLLNS